MKKRFIKYSIIAIILTYISVLLSVNYRYLIKSKGIFVNKSIEVCEGVLGPKGDTINKTIIEEGAFFTPSLNFLGNKISYSSGENIYEMDINTKEIKQLTYIGNCYNPVYFEKDNNYLAFARNNGIYIMDISKNSISKLVGSDNPQVTYGRPNFTKDGDIIYFMVTVLPKPEGHGFIEKNPAIYKISRDGKNNMKVLDGYEPVLSLDGKKLCYELNNNIYVLDLETKENKFIDSGKYPSWSKDGNYISYAKFERKSIPYKKIKGINNLFIDEESSNIYIASINNPKEKYKITKEEFENKEKEIINWANDLKHSNIDQHFLVASQKVFFDSLWSKDNKSLYISVYDIKKGGFILEKYNIKIK